MFPEATEVDCGRRHACEGPMSHWAFSEGALSNAEFIQTSPEEEQTQETQGQDTLKSCLRILVQQEDAHPGSPPGLHSIQANTGVTRFLQDRLGSSLGGQDSERPLATSIGVSCPRALLPLIQGKHVLVQTDNTVAVCYINPQGGTRSLHCLKVAQKLHFWSLPGLTSLRAIPGDLNQAADLLSRSGHHPGEWRIHS